MKKVILFFITLLFCFCVANAEEFAERFMDMNHKAAAYLGWLGFAHCVGIDDEEEFKKELYHLSLLKDVKIMDSEVAFNKLKQYTDLQKEFYDVSEKNPKLGYKNFKGCVRMFFGDPEFGSSGYHFVVERIVQKYCKKCK